MVVAPSILCGMLLSGLFIMNRTTVHATNLTLYGNEGYFGGNMCLYFLLFRNISVTLESSSLTARRESRGGGVLVTIDQDMAVNDNSGGDQGEEVYLHLPSSRSPFSPFSRWFNNFNYVV